MASCGNVVACAVEDGRVHLMHVGAKLEQRGLFKAHSQGASQAHFLGFLSHPYWLATGGNDGQVALWDLSRSPVVAAAPDGNAKPGAPAEVHHRKAKGRTKGRATAKGRSRRRKRRRNQERRGTRIRRRTRAEYRSRERGSALTTETR